jgi:arylamine N-acetyltransferase
MLGRLVAARVTPERRLGLLNGVLSVHRLHGASEQRRLGSVAELHDVLATMFGVEVPRSAELDAVLTRLLGP